MNEQRVAEHAAVFRDTLLKLEEQGDGAISSMVDLFADQACLSNAALRRRGEEHRGRDSIREFWQHYVELLGNARTRFSHLLTSPHAAGLFWETTLSEGEGDYQGVTLLTFAEDGKVTAMEGYYDPDAVRRTLTA